MFKWLFHILIFATNDGSGKYQYKEKPLKRQRKLGLSENVIPSYGCIPGVYNVHLPIMLESERQAVYRERKRKKGLLLLICLWHYDVAHRLYVLSNL